MVVSESLLLRLLVNILEEVPGALVSEALVFGGPTVVDFVG